MCSGAEEWRLVDTCAAEWGFLAIPECYFGDFGALVGKVDCEGLGLRTGTCSGGEFTTENTTRWVAFLIRKRDVLETDFHLRTIVVGC